MRKFNLTSSTVLVTGGTGSFGKAFIQRLLTASDLEKVIVYSRDELKQSEMQNDPLFSEHAGRIRYFLGDVRDLPRLQMAFSGVDFVVHAAALKQVPALEYNPFEAVKTNIIGAQNVIDAALQAGVKRVVALSTDKAAAPVNLYGATKLASDKLFVAANNIVGTHRTRFSVVRYGNVFGSRGSVVPLFLRLAKGGSVPVTDTRMTRFSITLSEGVDFVLKCLSLAQGGELFVPKIPSYLITDLVAAIDSSLEIRVTGIRPGEKLHEEMITSTDAMSTIEAGDHFIMMPAVLPPNFDKERYVSDGYSECPEGFRYASDINTSFLSVDSLRNLLEDYSREVAN